MASSTDTTEMKSNAKGLEQVLAHVLVSEAQAINSAIAKTRENISEAVHLSPQSTEALTVSCVGKSGRIARKITSIFCSLGRRATFLYAAEASKGDLGIILDDSVVLVLSYSGETTELSDLIAYCRKYDLSVIGITEKPNRTVGRCRRMNIVQGKPTEACSNRLAHTTTTTVPLAVRVSHLPNIQWQDFRSYHRGGKLNTRLLPAGDLLYCNATLLIGVATPVQEVVIWTSCKRGGTAKVYKCPPFLRRDERRRHGPQNRPAMEVDGRLRQPGPSAQHLPRQIGDRAITTRECRSDHRHPCHRAGRNAQRHGSHRLPSQAESHGMNYQ